MLDSSHRSQLLTLSGSGVKPSKRLHVLQVRMFRALVRESHVLVSTNLRDHHDSSDFLHHWVIRRAHSVHVTSDLSSQIRNADESLEDILRQYVSVAYLFEIIRVDIDVVSPKVHVSSRDSTHSPLCFRREFLFLKLR